jgi:hypothetical protein
MGKALAVASIAAFMVLGLPALALADPKGGNNGGDDNGNHYGEHHSAPEPLTILGLAMGAGGVAVARWASNRKSRNR